MSATEAAAAPVVAVEEAKPAEATPVTDTPAPAQEAPKVEETAAPVRLSLVHFSSIPYFIQGGCENRSSPGRLPPNLFPIFVSAYIHILHRSQEGAESAPAEQPATDEAKAVRTL
jgi:hypothetical protein